MSTDLLVFNGLDGATGDYLLPTMTSGQVAALALGQSIDATELNELKQRVFNLKNPHAGVEADARELSETGWGVIFASDTDPGVRDALKPLLDLRKEQAGDRYREYWGPDGYRPGETKGDWLERHGMGPGPANPDKVPYYLLIAGSPETISYRFQYQLDVQYAVGRIHFDTLQEYAQYAQSVVEAETRLALSPQAAFFGVTNPDDRATNLSTDFLVQPLAQKIIEEQPKWAAAAQKMRTAAGLPGKLPEWRVDAILRDEATQSRLSELLNGPQAPALLFTASHGIAFPNQHIRQLPHQGALVCQDWPGPQLWRGQFPEEFYFSADKLSSDANLLGTIAFFFACYGAGTPKEDEFAHQIWTEQAERRTIAPHDFVARLPQRMMGLPRGGALAVVGHVERAWGVSFFWGEAGPQLTAFKDCFERLIKGGYPIGYAVEVFNNRYAEISSDLTSEVDGIRNFNKRQNDQKLANLWTANNDARNYIVLGDPAARLKVGDGEAVYERPVIELTSHFERAVVPQAEAVTAPVSPNGDSTTSPQSPEQDLEPAYPATGNTGSPARADAGEAFPITGNTGSPSRVDAGMAFPITGNTGVPTVGGGQSTTSREGYLEDYGLVDNLKQAGASLSTGLGQFVNKLGQFLAEALDDAASLEVKTYVSNDISAVRYDGSDGKDKKLTGARLRALTRIGIDGDTLLCVPEGEDGQIDAGLWRIHVEMLQQAQASRAELLKTVVSAVSGLSNILKP